MAETKTSGEPKPSKNLLPPSARMPSPIRSPNRPSAHSAKPSVEQGRYQGLQAILGRESLLKLQKTKVLVVGAGGIGCELLKDLVLSGFESIHVVRAGYARVRVRVSSIRVRVSSIRVRVSSIRVRVSAIDCAIH